MRGEVNDGSSSAVAVGEQDSKGEKDALVMTDAHELVHGSTCHLLPVVVWPSVNLK